MEKMEEKVRDLLRADDGDKIWELDFPETLVRRLSSANVSVTTPVGFSPSHVVVPSEAASHFLVTDIKVGKDSQFVGAGCVPCSLFSAEAKREHFDFDYLAPGMTFTVSVTNASDSDRVFSGTVGGPSRKWTFDRERRSFLGYGHTIVPPRQWCHISVQPHMFFRPERLVVPKFVGGISVAGGFDVIDVGVVERGAGRDLHLIQYQRVQAGIFEESCEGALPSSPLTMVRPADFLMITVENTTTSERAFCGAIVGIASM